MPFNEVCPQRLLFVTVFLIPFSDKVEVQGVDLCGADVADEEEVEVPSSIQPCSR